MWGKFSHHIVMNPILPQNMGRFSANRPETGRLAAKQLQLGASGCWD